MDYLLKKRNSFHRQIHALIAPTETVSLQIKLLARPALHKDKKTNSRCKKS